MPQSADAELRKRQIADEIAGLGLCLPGSLIDRMTRCGSSRCRCHSDPRQLHGPYPSWIRKSGTKTITRTLSPAQADRYRPLFDNTKRLRELINELETLSAEIVEQAEGRARPPDSRGRYAGYAGDTTTDNVSPP
jgi:uncharacterized protein DUF6788